MIDTVTTLGKVNALNTAILNTATTSPSPKPLDTAGFHPVINGPVDDPDTYIKNSNSVIAKPLNILQLPNNDHFTVQFVMQIIKEYITVYSIMFQVSYKTHKMPTYYLYKTASIQFINANITNNIKVNTANAASLIT